MSTTTTALATLTQLEGLAPAKLFEPGAIDPIIERIKAEVRAIATDISTEQGRKDVASLAFKVARSKTFIDAQRRALVADEKKRLAVIDKEGKRIWEELESLQHEVRKPLTDWENIEAERVNKHEEALAILEALGVVEGRSTTADIEARLAQVEAVVTAEFQEFTVRAELAKASSLSKLRIHLAACVRADAERAELERLRAEQADRERKEREAAIAAKAAAEATAKAEREAKEREDAAIRQKQAAEAAAAKAEADRVAAVAKAEKDALAAAARAKADQEAAVQRERDRVEREKQEAAAAEAKREANRRHVAKVNREAVAALVANGVDEVSAVAAVALVAKGLVPNVKISY